MNFQNLLTAGGIAARNGHSRASVYEALERLDIKPALELPNGPKYYDKSVADRLKSEMRQPRRSK